VLYEKQQNFTDYDATYALANVVCNTIVDVQQAYDNTRGLVERFLSPALVKQFDDQTLIDNTRGLVERFLSPALVKQFDDQTLISTVGLDLPYFDMLMKKNRKHEKFTLFYGTPACRNAALRRAGTRFNTTKRVDVIFKLYDTFYSSGRAIDIIMTTPTAKSALRRGRKVDCVSLSER